MFGDADEKTLESLIRARKTFERKRPFSDHALTMEEFSEKYWLDGKAPYQYHSMEIEDGKSEVEQLAYNNIRALKNEAVKLRKMVWELSDKKQKQINECKEDLAHIKKIYKGLMICAMNIAFILTLQIPRHLRIWHSRKYDHVQAVLRKH